MAKLALKIPVPTWAAQIYIVLSIILIPWTVYLSASLPTYHLSDHWDVSWTGLDIGIIITLLLTGLFAALKSQWIVISASTVGSLLVVDAWFDVMSERRGLQFHEAILLAIFIELPLAFGSYYLAYKVLKDNSKAA